MSRSMALEETRTTLNALASSFTASPELRDGPEVLACTPPLPRSATCHRRRSNQGPAWRHSAASLALLRGSLQVADSDRAEPANCFTHILNYQMRIELEREAMRNVLIESLGRRAKSKSPNIPAAWHCVSWWRHSGDERFTLVWPSVDLHV